MTDSPLPNTDSPSPSSTPAGVESAEQFAAVIGRFEMTVRRLHSEGGEVSRADEADALEAYRRDCDAVIQARQALLAEYGAMQRRAEAAEADWQAAERTARLYDAQWDRIADALGMEDDDCEPERIADRAVSALSAALRAEDKTVNQQSVEGVVEWPHHAKCQCRSFSTWVLIEHELPMRTRVRVARTESVSAPPVPVIPADAEGK